MKKEKTNYEELLEIAKKLMTDAHHNRTKLGNRVNEKGWQVDKAGVDYINHQIAVAEMCDNPKEKIVALLHDILEDTYVTEEELSDNGFDQEIIDAVKLVTHVKDLGITDEEEEYKTYIRKLRETGNQTAINVKIADLSHNCDISRTGNRSTRKTEWYKWALSYLKDENKTPLIHSINKLKISSIRIMSHSGSDPKTDAFTDDFRVSKNIIQYEGKAAYDDKYNEWFYDVKSPKFSEHYNELCSVVSEMIRKESNEETLIDSGEIEIIVYFNNGSNKHKRFCGSDILLSTCLAIIRKMIPLCEEKPFFLEWEEVEGDEEHEYKPMCGKAKVIPAQIPIRKHRFEQLKKRKWKSDDGQWAVFCHPDHLCVYSTKTKYCIFDATYQKISSKSRGTEKTDSITAVIIKVYINQEEGQWPIEIDDRYLSLLSKIINNKENSR